jgi:tetratricopeptide (TPR) repeat protein
MLAQHNKSTSSTPLPNIPSIQPSQPTAPVQALFISGRVLIDGGGVPPEPVVIERLCNGSARRQGYTDSKGSFQLQLNADPGFQDASESTSITNGLTGASPNQSQKFQYQGCEIRAVLAGFVSSSVSLRLLGNNWQYDLGTIFLKRMEDVPGTTISVTTLSAPKEARRAYDKAQKSFDEGKFSDCEKELSRAVKIYPNFAAAWSLLGDLHQQRKQFEQAVEEYKQALAADSRFVNPSYGLALIAMQQGRWQDAAQLSDQVLKMNSLAFPAAYFYNAVANYNVGKLEAAEATARKFKSLDTEHRHPEVSLLLSQIDAKKNDMSAATQELREYLALAPNAPNAEEIRQRLKLQDESSVAKQ